MRIEWKKDEDAAYGWALGGGIITIIGAFVVHAGVGLMVTGGFLMYVAYKMVEDEDEEPRPR